jgi:hypothetical protein
MKRRDTEKKHTYSESVFKELKIRNLQGLLKEGDTYACGIEAYQVSRFEDTDFKMLDAVEEIERFHFCRLLGIPYHVIVASLNSRRFRLYDCVHSCQDTDYIFMQEFSDKEISEWWRQRQTFNQTKKMYDAQSRISKSLIDDVLFANNLAWGVNVDGFMLNVDRTRVVGIFEKRIRTWRPGYGVATYDPNTYFMGTKKRSGDYPSWAILQALAKRLDCALYLMTFDTDPKTQLMGVAEIKQVTPSGLSYSLDDPPATNLMCEPDELKVWLRPRLKRKIR